MKPNFAFFFNKVHLVGDETLISRGRSFNLEGKGN
jgi:hypothetical protein